MRIVLDLDGVICALKKPNETYLEKTRNLLKTNDAKIVAHYYVDESIQRITEDTNGLVSDSLEMAKYGLAQKEKTLIVAGVKFMGETAKILNPEKKILMLDMEATCSLDMSCNHDDFKSFCSRYPDREIWIDVGEDGENGSHCIYPVTLNAE